MKRFTLLFFATIMSIVMMAQRKETTILEVSGNLATPLTVHTSKGTYTLYDFMELNGVVSVRSAEDANGDKVVVSHEYKSHTSNGKSEYTRIYRFKTMYYKPSSSSSNSGNSYGGGNNSGSSYGGGSYSNGRMPYEHLRNIAKTSASLYGTWYNFANQNGANYETLIKINKDEVITKGFVKIDGELSNGENTAKIISATESEITARTDHGRYYEDAGEKKNGRTVAYSEESTIYTIRLVNGELNIYEVLCSSYFDRNGNFITKEETTLGPTKYLSIPDQF